MQREKFDTIIVIKYPNARLAEGISCISFTHFSTSTRRTFRLFILDEALLATVEIKVMTLPFVCITLLLSPCLSRKLFL